MRKNEVIIIMTIIAICLTTVLLMKYGATAPEKKVLKVTINKEIVLERQITSTENTNVDLFLPSGHTATLVINDGRVRILTLPEEICPRGICSHTGWIKSPGEIIVCLPNRIVISLH
ncbi:MAG: NusG domain II-containing protein [Bacillota bacterium]